MTTQPSRPGESGCPPEGRRFPHPEPERIKNRVWPVFLPFAGCPARCVYCAQGITTGTPERALSKVLESTRNDLDAALEQGTKSLELGFYGGTFTSLPKRWTEAFMELAARFRAAGLITRIRCSTRPDAVDVDKLCSLQSQGLDMVELGIQTFHDPALAVSRRGYTARTAHYACEAVHNAGLDLGIQLLPGLPGHTPQHFESDITATTGHKPQAVRLYPCVVLQGTELERMHAAGDFRPWALDTTVQALGNGLSALWSRGIPVIRIGLAPEQDLTDGIVAGPWHPALGQLVRSKALFNTIIEQYQTIDSPKGHLVAPRRFESDVLGHRKGLAAHYAKAGITELRFEDRDDFLLC